MSSRAIRRLREEREAAAATAEAEEDEGVGEELAEAHPKTTFLAMMDDLSEEDDESDQEDDSVQEKENGNDGSEGKTSESAATATAAEEATIMVVESTSTKEADDKATLRVEQENNKKIPKDDEADLDAILAEFQTHDEQQVQCDAGSADRNVLTSTLDIRDLDMEYVMRTSLLGGGDAGTSAASRARTSRLGSNLLFGPPRDGWGVRPKNYVGGGIGMITYHDDHTGGDGKPRALPWPYGAAAEQHDPESMQQLWTDRKRWYTFMYSDTYRKDIKDYERIQQTGDANALALFVAHHPFVVEALLQLAMVLYHTNQSQEGLALLRRSLWILECSSLASFSPTDGKTCFMDYDHPENASFFLALFRLIQVSSIAGCVRTSFAVSRYLLSLDPLRDPMGVLPLMDYFALATINEDHDRFLVELVDSAQLQICYRDESTGEYRANLLELPNWSYSYALALHRLHLSNPTDDSSQRAHDAMQNAIRKYPTIVELLLDKNEVDTTGRSFRCDWPSVLEKLRTYASTLQYVTGISEDNPILRHASLAASNLITKIFVQRSAKLWSGDHVVAWLYRNCESFSADAGCSVTLSPALIRYAKCDPSDYDDRFRTLPPEANPLDPGLLAPALAVDPNRRRFLRQQPQMPVRNEAGDGGPFAGLINVGGPPMQIIDPDSPLVEVFWRSMLPWNHVDGVPPPRR